MQEERKYGILIPELNVFVTFNGTKEEFLRLLE